MQVLCCLLNMDISHLYLNFKQFCKLNFADCTNMLLENQVIMQSNLTSLLTFSSQSFL